MDWAAEGKGNRNPVIVLNGDKGTIPINIEKKQGKSVTLDASKSFDPEEDQLNFKWWILPEAGRYQGEVSIPDKNASKITIRIPGDAGRKTFHVICEVTDNGDPQLTSYRRIIIQSKE